MLGFGWFRRMDSIRKREQCITGAVIGIQGVALSLLLLWFREGRPDLIAKNFLNWGVLEGYGYQFLRAARNTLILAIGGELGGIVIGLVLAVLVISKRRAVRAPARVYINFFRGTPLIWQLGAGGLLLTFGFNASISPFVVAILIFSLNTGAYAAEVFRAGIQSIERGQVEAARSLGMTYGQSLRYAIVPQAVRRVIPPLMNEFVILIKDTALVVVVGLLVEQYDLFTPRALGSGDDVQRHVLHGRGARVPGHHAAPDLAREPRRAPPPERARGVRWGTVTNPSGANAAPASRRTSR